MSALLRWLLPPRLLAWRNAIVRVRRLYRAKFGCAPRLLRPRTYTEKMQWRKLFDLDPQYAIFSDKLAARTFIAERAGQRWLPDLLWNGDDPESLPFETLAPPYVVKSSHGSGQVLRVHCIEDLDIAAARAQCASWLAKPYGLELGEPGYEFVPRRLMAERMLRGPDGDAPTELRAFCFDGRVRLIQSVFLREGRLSHGAFHDRDWQRRYWYLTTPARPDILPRPECLDELITLAERVAAGYDHVRVDFFETGDGLRIGEITLYSWSGLLPFRPAEADAILGSYWSIRSPIARALAAVLWRRREIRPPPAVAGRPADSLSESLLPK